MNIKRFKSSLILISIILCSCDGPIETSDSGQMSTDKIVAFISIRLNDADSAVTVSMVDSEWKTQDLGFGESTHQYRPNLVLSNGERLEITYNGEQKQFAGGAESPYRAYFSYHDSKLEELNVTFYRSSGEVIDMASVPGTFLDFSINEVANINAGYDSTIPIRWTNERAGKEIYVLYTVECETTGRTYRAFYTDDTGVLDIVVAELFDETPSQQCAISLLLERTDYVPHNPSFHSDSYDTSVEITHEIIFDINLQGQ